MAVKHLNFAGKSAVGQKQRPVATKSNRALKHLPLATKKVATTKAPMQKATLKRAISGIAKGSAVAAGNATRKTALAAGMKGALTASAKASGRIAGEAYKSGGGYKSNPTYGKGLGVSTPAKKRK